MAQIPDSTSFFILVSRFAENQEVQVYSHSLECPFGAYDMVLLGHPNMDGILDKVYHYSHLLQMLLESNQFSLQNLSMNFHSFSPQLLFSTQNISQCFNGSKKIGKGQGYIYKVQHPAAQPTSRLNLIILLTEVVHMFKLIPIFDTKIPGTKITSATCLDVYQQYYMNSFADKETYNVFHSCENQISKCSYLI